MYYYGPSLYLPRPGLLYYNLIFRRRQPKVDLAKIKGVLAEYGLELMGDPQWPLGQGRGLTLVVHTPRGKKLLKRYKHTVIRPAITYEHSILTYLAQVDFPSPRLVTTKTGQTLVCRDEDNYALFDFIEGGFQYCRYVLFPGQAQHFVMIAGELLAILHTELQGCVPEGYNPNGFKSQNGDRWRELEWFLSRLTDCVAEASRLNGVAGGEHGAWLLTNAKYLEESLVQLDAMLKEASLPRLIAHGDYGPYNLLFRKNAPVVILDFEIARLDWRVFDLVDAWWRFCNDRLLGLRINKMIDLLDAYQSRLPLTKDELRLMPEVWKFLHIRRCIASWYKFNQTQAGFHLVRARQHLKLVDWMIVNQDDLIAAVGTTGISS